MSASAVPDSYVLDSWAVLAWLMEEPVGLRVRAILEAADSQRVPVLMSWINAGEVYYMLVRKRNKRTAEEFVQRLPSLPIRLVLPGEDEIIRAAKLKSGHRISYADAFAADLAKREHAMLVTGDPELRDLKDGPKVEWLGPKS